jgi:hypothetical protein
MSISFLFSCKPQVLLHKNPNFTTDNTDNTDLHGSKEFN